MLVPTAGAGCGGGGTLAAAGNLSVVRLRACLDRAAGSGVGTGTCPGIWPGTGVASICSGAARGLSPLKSAPVTTNAIADQHDRQLLREERDVRHHGARDDAGVGGGRGDAVARGRLAVLGEIGFEQIALRLGLALERAQLHVLVAGRGGLPLELVERTGERLEAGARDPGVVFQRARHPLALGADLLVEIVDLRPHLPDPGMLRQERRGLLGELRP
jgi:hypothetical protein